MMLLLSNYSVEAIDQALPFQLPPTPSGFYEQMILHILYYNGMIWCMLYYASGHED